MTSHSQSRANSYIWVNDLSLENIQNLFSKAKDIKSQFHKSGRFPQSLSGKQVAIFFSEASTRTKLSFQMAVQRMGGQCLIVDSVANSSMSKGETFADTFWTLHALRPDGIVVRCGGQEPLEEIVEQTEVPIVNGGFGRKAHPTQALLDLFTMQEQVENMQGLKVLFVGDIVHSRVAASNFKLLNMFGAQVAVCGPAAMVDGVPASVKVFDSMDEALPWTDFYVGLRVQFERHNPKETFSHEDYVSQFSLNKKRLEILSKDAFIMHPGPVNWGVEFQDEVRNDKRFLMWSQKENGVYTRAALLEKIIGEVQS